MTRKKNRKEKELFGDLSPIFRVFSRVSRAINKGSRAKHAKHRQWKWHTTSSNPLPIFRVLSRVSRAANNRSPAKHANIANEKGRPPAQTLSPFFASFSVFRGLK